jgi:hypothetical protein
MRILIDKAACVFMFQLTGKNPTVIEGDASVSRTYSALTLAQLQRLYRNHTGFTLATTDYNAAVQTCKALAIRLLTTESKGDYRVHEETEGSAG